MSEVDTTRSSLQINLTADIIAAYVANNSVPVSELANLLRSVHAALGSLAVGMATAPAKDAVEKPTPAQIKKSITPEYLVCLEDGLQFKSLKRHLNTKYNLSPEQYRARWSLPSATRLGC